ncbi:hypothetical protein [Tahibacter sp.]|uniref:hypothetical protein n=1 Tax=Tahibacter sp. TaxID=2056211 RepID=UPI0028C39640|nr:hypothetical protein [Tahibacter sp.]
MRMLKTWASTSLWLIGSVFALQAAAAEKVIDGVAAQQRNENAAKDVAAVRSLLVGSQASGPVSLKRIQTPNPADPVAKALTPSANSFRAYAPSCLAHELPTLFSGPLYPAPSALRVLLAARDSEVDNQFFEEFVNVRLWRIPCSSSGQFFDAVTLLAIDRDLANEGRTDRYPLFPGLRLTQGTSRRLLVRAADEPNTVVSHVFADEPLVNSGTYVLENFATTSASTARWDFNNQFTLTFLNFFDGDPGKDITVPAYNPTQSTYPTAFQNIPITGYLAGNWFDPAHSGEGMLVQVFDLPGTTRRLFTFAWFTYGTDGRPVWLFGASQFDADSRGPLAVPTIYQSGGGFAGNFGPTAQSTPWGTVTFRFPTCYSMAFDYSSTLNIPGVPSGSGTRTTWVRTVDSNGMTCE